MKPSVARRCKDQVREDGGRGWQRERGEMRAFGTCTLFWWKREKRNAHETGRIVRVNREKREKHLSIKKRGNVILQWAHTSTL